MDIAIIGSCQSRDIFNTKFIPEYKKNYKVTSYFTMTSMLSIMGKPVNYSYGNLVKTPFKDWLIEHWYQEFEKNALITLETRQPDVLLLDFYADARYGAIAYNGSYIINRIGRLKDREILDLEELGQEYSYECNAEEFIALWKETFDGFMAFMKERLPNTVIIVNTVKGTKVVTNDNGDKYLSPNVEQLDVDTINSLWKLFDEYAISTYGLKAIRYDKEYTLDPNYPFSGLGYALVHFHKDYYIDCYEGLKSLTEDIVSFEKKENCRNLVIDSNYSSKLKNWTNKKGKFKINEYDSYNAVMAISSGEDLVICRPQMWSKPIEISDSGAVEYTLSFYINIQDVSMLDEDEVVFAIRTFKTVKGIKYTEALEEYRLTIQGQDIRSGEDYRYVFTFTSKAKYVKVAPFMFKYVPGVEYSRIKLERSSSASEYSV